MSVYIIRPKTSVVRSLDLASRQFTPESRPAQVREVVNLWHENPGHQQIESWLDKNSQVFMYPRYSKITGASVVEMPDDEAEKMRRELPNTSILRDQPIKLIQPVRKAVSEVPNTMKAARAARNVGTLNELPANKLWHLEHINLIKRRQDGYRLTGENITVAVLDTGIDSQHPELEGRVTRSYQMTTHGDIELTLTRDTNGHGTHIAGLICGRNFGVAPNIKLIDCLVIPGGTGKLSNLILWLDWLGLEEQAEVSIANISAGIPEFFPELNDLIYSLLTVGILSVSAVGNDGFNNHIAPGNCKNSLSVGATNSNRKLAFFSGNGRMNVNNQLYDIPYLVAPGEQVYSSVIGGGYEAWDGTSMATAIVSGVAALTLEYNLTPPNRNITVGSLINQLRERCIDLGEERERQGMGLIQVP